MTIRTADGNIGFTSEYPALAQFWKPSKHDLREFAEDVLFWADAISKGFEFASLKGVSNGHANETTA